MEKLICHIGTNKAGSTSLKYFLINNRNLFEDFGLGVFIPDVLHEEIYSLIIVNRPIWIRMRNLMIDTNMALQVLQFTRKPAKSRGMYR